MVFTLIHVGGIFFWLLVLAELIYLYHTVDMDKPRGEKAAFSVFIFTMILLLLGDVAPLTIGQTLWGNVYSVVALLVGYLAIGVLWSFLWMWPRWGSRRQRPYHEHKEQWLRERGIQGTEIPDRLKKEWSLYIFGNEDQQAVEHVLRRARDSFGAWKRVEKSPNEGDHNAEFIRMAVETDPNDIFDRHVRMEIVDARRKWLLTQKVEVSDQIPAALLARWTERVKTPLVNHSRHSVYADLATEPLVKHNKSRLATWAACWPVSVTWYFLHEFFHDVWLGVIRLFQGALQRIMHFQYRNVRKDFEVVESAPTDKVGVVVPLDDDEG